jgi:predicted metal-dependent hydrolase
MKVTYSKRKTFALIIDKDGLLLVRAPIGASKRQIKTVVDAHQSWIEEKQAEVVRKQQTQRPPRFVDGEAFWYLGQRYPLSITNQEIKPPLQLHNRFILAQPYLPQAEAVFEAWYKMQARQVLKQRVEQWAKANRLTYTSLRITSARTRWGSCSSKGSLNFSWRLVLAPLVVIDYVVVHELAHLKQRNHSKAFWAEVEVMMPEYRQHRRWLKENGYRLGLDRIEAL